MNNYPSYSSKIKSGDLLVWDAGTTGLISEIYGFIIQIFTRSEYIHVGVALVEDGEVYFVEAAPPAIKQSKLNQYVPFYHIPMDIDWTDGHRDILLSKIGQKYSIWEAIMGYLKSPTSDRYWQCAEFVHWFYREIGIDINFGYTPKSVVNAAQQAGHPMLKIID